MAKELFNQQSSYTAQDIEVLEGLEAVRKRPGMYIGGTDLKALHHMLAEIFDNSMDEVVAGHANRIDVSLEDDNWICIKDNGRGIPVDPHPKFPELSALEVILTTLHSGGKFSNKVYQTAGGLHGVGLSVVNALSKNLEVYVTRNGITHFQKYSKGQSITPLVVLEKPLSRGTLIRFQADEEIFAELKYDPERIANFLQSKAYLYPGVKIVWQKSHIFFFKNGLADYIQNITQSHLKYIDSAVTPEGKIEWCLVWGEKQRSISYCNTISTPLGGTHEAGLRQGILKSVREFAASDKLASSINAEDIFQECTMIVSLFWPNPQFQGQTKEKLSSPEVSKWVEGVIKDHADHWFAQSPLSNEIIKHVLTFTQERLRKKQTRDVSVRTSLPGKLAECSSNDPEEREIFLVEGDSAGGSAKQARNRKNQAVLPLRGKILNVANTSFEKLTANQEISNLIVALGCGVGKDLDLKKLRYHKVIIMTDADVDGDHIACLLLTFFYLQMHPLLEAGHIYLAQPPLYRLSNNQTIYYAKNEAHKEKLLNKEFKNRKVDISRFKGLGEMLPNQLKETTMDPNSRTLLQVELNEDYLEFVSNLMGRNPEYRAQFFREIPARSDV